METRDHTFSIVSQKMQFPTKIPRFVNSPGFSPKVVEIPNLGTNSPKVGTLVYAAEKPTWDTKIFLRVNHTTQFKRLSRNNTIMTRQWIIA